MNAARMLGVPALVMPDGQDLESNAVSHDTEVIDCSSDRVVTELYEHLGRTAALKASKIVGRMDVALEIVQETFLKLWKTQPVFPNRKAAFVWVYRTTHNAAIDHLRLAVNKHSDIDTLAPDVLASVLPNTSIEEREVIMAAASRLSERELQIIMYQLVDGMTQGEIADVIGVSRKTIVRDVQKIDEKLASFRKELL